MITRKRTASLFTSYSHRDMSLKVDLHARLRPQLETLPNLRIHLVDDSLQMPGGEIHGIVRRLEDSDYGLPLLSVDYLSSPFILKHELPLFVDPVNPKPCIPVGLRPVRFDGTQELRGLEALRVYLDPVSGRFYSDLSTSRERDRFAEQLALKIYERVMGNEWKLN